MYADAGLFLVPVLQSDRVPPAVSAARFLEALARGTRKVSTATLTWDEVVYVVRRLLAPRRFAREGRGAAGVPESHVAPGGPHGVARCSRPVPNLGDATEGCDPCRSASMRPCPSARRPYAGRRATRSAASVMTSSSTTFSTLTRRRNSS